MIPNSNALWLTASLPIIKLRNSIGAGLIGELKYEVDASNFLRKLKKQMKTDIIRYTPIIKDKIKKVALCGGSGSHLLDLAKSHNADIFITADFKYHDFFMAEDKIIIADIGHYESEQFTKDLIYEFLTKKFSKFAILFGLSVSYIDALYN